MSIKLVKERTIENSFWIKMNSFLTLLYITINQGKQNITNSDASKIRRNNEKLTSAECKLNYLVSGGYLSHGKSHHLNLIF